MKIVEIVKGLDIGGDSGGAELFGIKLAQQLHQNEDCTVMICAFFSVNTEVERQWQKQLNAEGIETFFVSEWGGNNNPSTFLKGVYHLFRKIRKDKVDVAHSHFQLGTLAALWMKGLGVAKTAFRTSHIRREWSHGRWTWFLKPVFMDRVFPRLLDGEVGVSQAVCDYLTSRHSRFLKKEKIHRIYNGIYVEQVVKKSQQPVSPEYASLLTGSDFVIGCANRLAEQKGYVYLLQAMRTVAERIPDCRLIIAGDGELRAELENMVAQFNLQATVKFLGLQNNVPALMKTWDVFVLPSLWEGLPTVILEAMACEVPVIATDIPGTTELVIHNETGILVPERNTEALAQAIIQIYEQPGLRKHFVTQAKAGLSTYDMPQISSQYLHLFHDRLHDRS